MGILGCGFLLISGYLYQSTVKLLTEELHAELAGDLAWMEAEVRVDGISVPHLHDLVVIGLFRELPRQIAIPQQP
jgi:hypothetical protein